MQCQFVKTGQGLFVLFQLNTVTFNIPTPLLMWCEYIFLNRLSRKTKGDLPTEKHIFIFVCLVFFPFFFYEYDVKDMKGA